jgi:hypothetical protein
MEPAVILSISIVGLVLISLSAWIITGSIISFFIVIALSALVSYILHSLGVFEYKITQNGLEIQFHENSPSPHEKQHDSTKKNHNNHTNPKHLETKEVFHVDGQYTYTDAPAVCSAYNSELASYDQLMDAFSKNAEWCSYGWSASGMALYPTQQSTWNALQQEPDETKRTACGHPGVNGGYFDQRLKFGVNCYGIKPISKSTSFPVPLPGKDTKAFDELVDKFKKMLGSMIVSPFNRNVWSQSGELKYESKNAVKSASSYLDVIEEDIKAIPNEISNVF